MTIGTVSEVDGLSRVEANLQQILAAHNTSLDPSRFSAEFAAASHFTMVRALHPRRAGQFGWFFNVPGLRVLDLRPRWFENVEEALRRGAKVSVLAETRRVREIMEARLGVNPKVDRVTTDEIVGYGGRWDVVLLDGTADHVELMSLLRLAGRALAPGGRLLWAVASDDSLNTRSGITYDCAVGHVEGGDGLAGVRLSLDEATHILDRVGLRRTNVYYALPDPVMPEVLYQTGGVPDPWLLAPTKYYAPRRDAWAEHPDDVIRNARLYNTVPELVNGWILVARAEGDEAMGRALPHRVILSTDRPLNDAFVTALYDEGAVKTAAFPQGKPALARMVANHDQLRAKGLTVLDVMMEGDAVQMPAFSSPTLLQELEVVQVSTLRRSWMLGMLDIVASAIMRCTPNVASREPVEVDGVQMPVVPGSIVWNPAAVLPQGYVDLTVEKAAIINDKLTFFDQKRCGLPVTAGFVLYRSLVRIASVNPTLAKALPPEELAARYGLVSQWAAYGAQDEKLDAAYVAHLQNDPITRWSNVGREVPQY